MFTTDGGPVDPRNLLRVIEVTAGVYTIFEGVRFIYVGMAGKNIRKAPVTTDLNAPTDVAAPNDLADPTVD